MKQNVAGTQPGPPVDLRMMVTELRRQLGNKEEERRKAQDRIKSLEENMRFLEEMMKDNSPGGGAEAAKKLEQYQQRIKQYEMQLKISENKAREALMEVLEGKKALVMKNQQEVELGKVIKHLEAKVKESQSASSDTGDQNVWRERFLMEEADKNATQNKLLETEKLVEVRTKKLSEDCDEKVKKLEERVNNIKTKAKEKIAEKDNAIKESEANNERCKEMIKMLETTCKEAVKRQEEAVNRSTEQEEMMTKHNKLRSQFEYKINYLEERLKKATETNSVDKTVKDELEAKVNLLDSNLKKSQAEHTKTMKIKLQQDSKVIELENKLKETDKNMRNKHQPEMKILEQKLKDAETKINESNMKFNVQKNVLVKSFENQKMQQEEKIKKLEERVRAKEERQTTKNQYDWRMRKLSDELNTTKLDLAKSSAKVKELEAGTSEKTVKITNLEAKSKEQLAELQDRLRTTAARNIELDKSLNEKTEELEMMVDSKGKYEEQITFLEDKCAKLQSGMDDRMKMPPGPPGPKLGGPPGPPGAGPLLSGDGGVNGPFLGVVDQTAAEVIKELEKKCMEAEEKLKDTEHKNRSEIDSKNMQEVRKLLDESELQCSAWEKRNKALQTECKDLNERLKEKEAEKKESSNGRETRQKSSIADLQKSLEKKESEVLSAQDRIKQLESSVSSEKDFIEEIEKLKTQLSEMKKDDIPTSGESTVLRSEFDQMKVGYEKTIKNMEETLFEKESHFLSEMEMLKSKRKELIKGTDNKDTTNVTEATSISDNSESENKQLEKQAKQKKEWDSRYNALNDSLLNLRAEMEDKQKRLIEYKQYEVLLTESMDMEKKENDILKQEKKLIENELSALKQGMGIPDRNKEIEELKLELEKTHRKMKGAIVSPVQVQDDLFAGNEEILLTLKSLPSKKRKRMLKNIFTESKKLKETNSDDECTLIEESSEVTVIASVEKSNTESSAIETDGDPPMDNLLDNVEFVIGDNPTKKETPKTNAETPKKSQPILLFSSWANPSSESAEDGDEPSSESLFGSNTMDTLFDSYA